MVASGPLSVPCLFSPFEVFQAKRRHPPLKTPARLAIYLCIYLSSYLSIYLFIYPSIHLSVYPSSHLSIYPSIHLSIFSIYLAIYLSISSVYLTVYLAIYPSTYLSVSRSACLSVYLSTCLSASLKTKLFCETYSFLEVDNIKNEAILRDFLNFRTRQHPKRSKFCETSSIFEFDNIKNKAILRDFLPKWKVECRADGLVPMRFAMFPLHLSKVLRLPRKIDARSYEVLHLSRKIILANRQIWCSKMQPISGNQRPDILTSLMNMSFVLRLPREMHLCRPSSNVPRLPSFLELLQNPHVLLTFDKVHNPLRLPREITS